MKVDVRRDVADFATVNGDLVGKHARSRDLDGIWPVVVVVTKGIGEVKDRFLGNARGVFGNIEVSGLNGSLGDGVRHQEEIELAIDDFGLLDEALVHIGTLRGVEDSTSLVAWGLLEESLSDSLVNNGESDLRQFVALSLRVVLVSKNLLKLIELKLDDLLAHGITNTISVDEDVVWQESVEVLVGLKSTAEVLLKNA